MTVCRDVRERLPLFVGDDLPEQEGETWRLAAKRREFYRWRAVQRKEFASDTAWGDVEDSMGERYVEIEELPEGAYVIPPIVVPIDGVVHKAPELKFECVKELTGQSRAFGDSKPSATEPTS